MDVTCVVGQELESTVSATEVGTAFICRFAHKQTDTHLNVLLLSSETYTYITYEPLCFSLFSEVMQNWHPKPQRILQSIK